MVIAIDGPSGSGKTSTAKLLAEKLGFYYCDSGSLYRAITYHLIGEGTDLDSSFAILNELKRIEIEYDVVSNSIILNNRDVTQFLRTDRVTSKVSKVSSIKIVRDFLISVQRILGVDENIILDGRDIGTTVFPNAEYKFYIDANIEVRARRRFEESKAEGSHRDYENILKMMKERDSYDQGREHSPLAIAKDAICIDTTDLNLDEQVDKIINIIKKSKEQEK